MKNLCDADIEKLEDEAYQLGYGEGYDNGVIDGELDAEDAPPWTEAFLEALNDKAFDPLDAIEVHYDAALKAVVCSQKGREVSFK